MEEKHTTRQVARRLLETDKLIEEYYKNTCENTSSQVSNTSGRSVSTQRRANSSRRYHYTNYSFFLSNIDKTIQINSKTYKSEQEKNKIEKEKNRLLLTKDIVNKHDFKKFGSIKPININVIYFLLCEAESLSVENMINRAKNSNNRAIEQMRQVHELFLSTMKICDNNVNKATEILIHILFTNCTPSGDMMFREMVDIKEMFDLYSRLDKDAKEVVPNLDISVLESLLILPSIRKKKLSQSSGEFLFGMEKRKELYDIFLSEIK